jgi:hypothetical protein
LEQHPSGWLFSADGGHVQTESVNERMAGGYPVRKHAGNVKVDEITVSCGAGMTKQFYSWIQKSMAYEHERHDGAIVHTNYDFKEIVRQTFQRALITEIGLPALDATSKESGKMTIKFSPEMSQLEYSGGTRTVQVVPTDPPKQKLWTASNFRVRISGLEDACRNVSKVEAINIKQNVVENTIGEKLIFDKEPAQIDFPNVILTIPESDAEKWYKWHKEFVIEGKSYSQSERNGGIEYLSSDLASTLFSLELENLGIIKFTPDKAESGGEKIRNVKIEMYCEKMSFDYKQKATYK